MLGQRSAEIMFTNGYITYYFYFLIVVLMFDFLKFGYQNNYKKTIERDERELSVSHRLYF